VPRDLEIDVPPDVAGDRERVRAAAARAARVPVADLGEVRLLHRALDARRGVRVRLRLRLFARGEAVPSAARPAPAVLRAPLPGRPVVVVGDGPAGLFAALRLGERGIPTVIVERGKAVQPRRRDLAALNKRGAVDPESNYCFGEGGAGTYSDGKLYTRAHKRGPVDVVLRQLVAHGADSDVLIDARPHVGSNRLPRIVTALRATLAGGGIETRFGTRVVDLVVERGRVRALVLADGTALEAAAVVLATGHSARDVHAAPPPRASRCPPPPIVWRRRWRSAASSPSACAPGDGSCPPPRRPTRWW
jgi:uncharacterized FAD-dependent dehydrogenase